MTQHIQTALITGASRGLGLALAQALAHHGWRLIITARGTDELARVQQSLSRTTKVVAVAGDVGDPRHLQTLGIVARDLGGLDAVVNNAGILGPVRSRPCSTIHSAFYTTSFTSTRLHRSACCRQSMRN